jgi:ATP-dependent RNA helicase RhlE
MYHNNHRFHPAGRVERGSQRRARPIRSFSDQSMFIKKATAVALTQYIPTHSFADFALNDRLMQNVSAHGYTTPTPIQDQAIPIVSEGRDVVGVAQTGTGKTAAFLLPLIHKVFANRSQKVLIIVPTRELAVQIDDEFRAFAKNMGLFSVLVIGGMSMGKQIYSLRKRPNFVIGTPGRLKDLDQQGVIRFSEYSSIVLDEVDRMLDMGFIRDIQYIIAKLPPKRHSMFFSATLPQSIRGVMDQLLKDPLTISIKTQATSDHVNQDIVKLNGKPKIDVLHDLLISDGFKKVLLFGRTKWGIEKLSNELHKRGFKVAAIHGNKRQSARQRALDEFKSDRIQVLLATDIASRGIDVTDVTHVINYDLPGSYEDYIHRIGRTGRADKFGTALTFVE